MYDLIIIGAGPAGLTAGIYASRREMKNLIISKDIGGQVVWAHEIENYPGFLSISNFEFIQKFQEQAIKSGSSLVMQEVVKITKINEKHFIVYTKTEKYECKAILLTLGLFPRRLGVPGEEKFNGKGVSYCANCDGPFYKDKNIAVIGGGNSAFDAAEVMSKIASRAYLLNRSEEYKAFESLVAEVKERKNIEIINNAQINEILGVDKVNSLKYLDKKEKIQKTIKVDGIFVEIGRIASTDFVKEFVKLDKIGQIIVDNNYMTNTPGIFAAGDVVSGEYKQITIACGQATAATLSAYQYLQT
jgi:thioredoxin-disulfide reductase